MPRLDAFIEKMLARPPCTLVLETGCGAALESEAGRVRLIQLPLTSEQILSAVREIAPPDGPALPREGGSAFLYRSPLREVEVKVEAAEGRVRVVVAALEPATSPAAAAAPAPPRPAPAAAPSPEPAGHAPALRATPAPAAPREAMEALLADLARFRGSDLHLTSGEEPALRVDGDVVPLAGCGRLAPDRLAALLWSIAPARNREEGDASHDTDFAHETEVARFRVNVFADRRGIGAVFRIIPRDVLSASQLGIPPAVLDLCALSKGLVLVTGPTGSGKSTTLAALVDHVNRTRDDHIITIEDPIEFVHPSRRCLVHQREVGVHTDSFKRALRAALREDPDVVLVGELRDLETIAIAIETAETGHLVFGTLHTNTAPSTVDRVIDQFPVDRQAQVRTMLSESLRGVVSQMLCKKVGGGRVAALEILVCNSGVANLIREAKTFQIPSIMQTGRAQGMVTLNDALMELVKAGTVAPAEALRRAVAKRELEGLLSRAGIAVGDAPAAAR
jgi:twitching motility protein PilT